MVCGAAAFFLAVIVHPYRAFVVKYRSDCIFVRFMKLKSSIFFIFYLLAWPTLLVAQDVSNSPYGRVEKVGTTVREWFNYAKTISDFSDQERTRKNFVFPDTTVFVGYSTGVAKVSTHGVGQVLDPCAPLFSQTNAVLDSTRSYTVEKVSIAYRYFRPFDTLSDILWVQFYNDGALEKVVDPNWPSGASYASAEYDWRFRKGSDPTLETTYFLGNDDTSNFGAIRNLEIPVDLYVRGGGKFGISLSFDHFNKTYAGDTLDPYLYPKKKVNAFMTYEVQDVESNVEPGHYNHSLIANTPIRYNSDLEGWNGRYRPGTSWASTVGIFHLDVSFLLRFEEPLLVTERNGLDGLTIGPNPVDDVLNVYGLKADEDYLTQVFDVRGCLLITNHNIESSIELSELSSGVYFLKISQGDAQIQKRFTKL